MSGLALSGEHVEIGAMTRQSDLQARRRWRASAGSWSRRLTMSAMSRPARAARSAASAAISIPRPSCRRSAPCRRRPSTSSGPGGERTVAAADWFQGYLQSALDERELLESIRLPSWPQGSAYGFRNMPAVVAISPLRAPARCSPGARMARLPKPRSWCSASTPAPVRLATSSRRCGRKLDQAAIGASMAEGRALDAMGDAYVSADYRSRLAGVDHPARPRAAAGRSRRWPHDRTRRITLTVNGAPRIERRSSGACISAISCADARPYRHASRLRARRLRRLHGDRRRTRRALLPDAGGAGRRRRHRDGRGPRQRGRAVTAAAGVLASITRCNAASARPAC